MQRKMIGVTMALVLAWPVVALAQEEGESMPETVETPAEAAPAEGTAEVPADDPGTPPDDGGQLMFGGAPNPDPGAAAGQLDAYTIQSGDTLWDICARMLGDPFFWPKLWTFNQYITNPHWIYPGNILNFKEGTETSPPQFEVTKPEAVAAATPAEPMATPVDQVPIVPEEIQESGGAATAAEETTPPVVATVNEWAITPPKVESRPFEVNLRQEGFISENQISPLGYIYKSEVERTNLAENDEVYIRFNDSSQARPGAKFTVYRTLRRVKHPTRGGSLGFLIKILAQLEVVSVNGEIATAKCTTSYDYINRGDPITEAVDVLKQVNLQPNSTTLEGWIVESMVDEVTILGNGDVVYLDKGKADGLNTGNTVDVVRSGDGLMRPKDRDRSLPTEVVGRLVIVGVRDQTSTAVVVDSFDALQIGDKVRIVGN